MNNKTGLDIDVVPAAGILGGTVHTDVAHVALANFFAKKVRGGSFGTHSVWVWVSQGSRECGLCSSSASLLVD